ncbi:type II toxin-antitoxin system toxin DNA ADP-ribosyl transferase DarT [Profundibacter sp.]
MPQPAAPKIYHIVHVDRLPSIIADGQLWCDEQIIARKPSGTVIGMNSIKQRRLTQLKLTSHPDLFVGQCVPFYFCPRSIMLYLIHRNNHPEMTYRGGQGPIVHLECDLHRTVTWANQNNRRWAFTLSNAGAFYFEDRNDLALLGEIDWDAVQTNRWSGNDISRSVKEGKQAEFLMEHSFPWELVERVGVSSRAVYGQASAAIQAAVHKPHIEIKPVWYY